ncbi:MAG: response regulator transcription factor [Oscillospiraceae bacterium]
MFNILVVEDDANTRKLMEAVLLQNGYRPFLSENGVAALEIMEQKQIDLVVLDIMMPKMDGYEFAKTLREGNCNLPILMVTAREGIEDKKKGFRIGADDYMVKPVNNDELVLRINALLRRSRIANEHQLTIGETTFNYEELSVRREGAAETLPQKEFLIIYKLLAYPNKIFTRLQIMDEIWGLDTNTDEHSVDVHINRLRNRFKDNPDFKIVTIRGLGYKVVINNEN